MSYLVEKLSAMCEGDMRVHPSSATAVAYILIGLGCFCGAYFLLPKGIPGAVLMTLMGGAIVAVGVGLLRLRHLPIVVVEDGRLNYRSPFSGDYDSVALERVRSVKVRKSSSGRGYCESLDVWGDFTSFSIGVTNCKGAPDAIACEIERLAEQARKR